MLADSPLAARRHARPRWRGARGVLLGLASLGLVVGQRGGVAVGQASGELRVAITSPAPGAVLDDRVTIEGWAVEPASPDNAGVNASDVQLWLGAPPDGHLLDYAEYGLPSDDAARFYGPQHRDSGFAAQWNPCSFPPGPYHLWAFASSLARPGLRDQAEVDVSVAPCGRGVELYRAVWEQSRGGRNERVEQRQSGDAWSIHLLQPGGSAAGVEGVYADVRMEVTAQLVGRDDGYYFLDFRVQPGPGGTLTDSYYRFAIHPDSGSFHLTVSQPDPAPSVELIPWTASPAIRRGPPANQLAVETQGPRLRVYANDTLLGEVTDDTFPWGKIRFGAATGEDPTAEALFRDFVISSLSAAP